MELQELVKDAPKFVSMERGELVAYAYAMYAAGVKMDAENDKLREQGARLFDKTLELGTDNAKLRKLVLDALTTISWCTIDCCPSDNKKRELNERARVLGIEVG